MYFCGIADEAGATIERQLAAHLELGWKHIELRMVDGTNFTVLAEEAYQHACEALADAEITVSCFASALANWGRKISNDFAVDVAELRSAIPRMQQLECNYIRCMSYPNDGWLEVEWRDEVVRRLRELSRMAEDGGVVLVHENCDGWGGQSPQHTLELLERVNSPAFKLVYDTGNPASHEQDAVDYLRQVIDHVVHVHIKDGSKHDGVVTYHYPGEGSCHVDECIRLLRENGYDAGYSIEPHIASIIHTGEVGGDREALLWDSYISYGHRLMSLYQLVADEG